MGRLDGHAIRTFLFSQPISIVECKIRLVLLKDAIPQEYT